jgi:hypothetical protein
LTTDVNSIIDTNWNVENVTKPDIIKGPTGMVYFYSRMIWTQRIRKIEDYMDIISRSYYDNESYDAYECNICSESESDCIAMIDEVRRICATFTPSGDDMFIIWEGGDFILRTSYFWEFKSVIMVKKTGVVIPNA